MRRRATTPQERAVEVCAAYLDSALDDVINARLALDPDQGNWSAPTHAISVALGEDAEWNRGSRHLMEIETRLRELIPERLGLGGHLEECRTEMLGHVERSAEIGWRVGVSTGLRRRGEA
ncbi:MAG: hypothetical protein H6735_00140 [Alphaproteobacteria bacterium]|nr:hypothetical protein [Alphaproteobacteria bacterium]